MSKKDKTNPAEENWEIKNRNYVLRGDRNPLTYTIKSRHTEKYPLLYFDTSTKTQRALRYATNQSSCFTDEQKGEVTLKHIMFTDGSLFVPKEEQALQKLLSLYHPDRDKRFIELKPVLEAANEVDEIEYQIQALNTARALDIDQAEAILRTEIGSEVSKMASKEVKRDLLKFARDNSRLFIELANDENVQLRNFGIKSVEQGLISLANDQRSFTVGKNKRKLFSVPFDENPYAALAAWFKTDEGVEIYKSIAKKLV
tara:strand:+ start:225 stop:995 length:771 start_codon:yes stop_codon:yes gene_type:complete